MNLPSESEVFDFNDLTMALFIDYYVLYVYYYTLFQPKLLQILKNTVKSRVLTRVTN